VTHHPGDGGGGSGDLMTGEQSFVVDDICYDI
jgi:hypothetical protein